MEIPRIYFTEIAPGAAFHAVRAVFSKENQNEVRLHCHDFYEWIVVIAGEAQHLVNGSVTMLRNGQLVLIRPEDAHAIYPTASSMDFVNIAFPCDVWDDFVRATGLQDSARKWCESTTAPCLDLPSSQRQHLWQQAISATIGYHSNPTRLAFGPFWNAAGGALAAAETTEGRSEQPAWLRNAVTWAGTVDVEGLSLDALVEASGVSFGHLSRTLKATSGLTPTELINELRVKRAGFELAATDRDIAAIAFDCGFENLSYFYRRFRKFHGKSPRIYREDARRSLPE